MMRRAMDIADLDDLIGRRIRLPGHFVEEVKLEDVRTLDGAVEIRVRTAAGSLDETILTEDQLDSVERVEQDQQLVAAGDFFDLIEAHRIAARLRARPELRREHVRGPRPAAPDRRRLPAHAPAGATALRARRRPRRRQDDHGRAADQGAAPARRRRPRARPLPGAAHGPVAGRAAREVRRAVRALRLAASQVAARRQPLAATRPRDRLDRLRQARGGDARPAARRLGPGRHRRGAQVLGRHAGATRGAAREARPHAALSRSPRSSRAPSGCC